MKLLRLSFSICLALSVVLAPRALSVELEHLDITRIADLRKDFGQAEIIDSVKIKTLNESKWVCDMYGMSSRMQVERGVKLYHFVSESNGEALTLKNRGAQVVKVYSTDSGLSGQHGSIYDHIRISKDGRLISKLEIRSPQTSGLRTLAISICNRHQI